METFTIEATQLENLPETGMGFTIAKTNTGDFVAVLQSGESLRLTEAGIAPLADANFPSAKIQITNRMMTERWHLRP